MLRIRAIVIGAETDFLRGEAITVDIEGQRSDANAATF